MKKFVFTLILALGISIAYGQTDARKQLSAAIYEEEVNGDLDKAIKLYELIVSDFADNRTVAAEALYRLGLSNEKLGNQKASTYYENLINNYGDQSDKVKLARIRLNILLASTPENDRGGVMMKNIYSGTLTWGKLSPSGRYFSYTDWGRDWNLWYIDTQTGDTLQINTDGSNVAPYAMENFSVWSYGDDKVFYDYWKENEGYSLRIWDRTTGQTSVFHKSKQWVTPLQWTRDNKQVLTVTYKEGFITLGLHNVKTKEVREFKTITGDWRRMQGPRAVFFASVSPQGKYIIWHSQEGDDNNLKLLNTSDGSTKNLENHSSKESDVIWEADGKAFLFISDRSGVPAIYRWAFENGNVVGDPELIYQGISEKFNLENIGTDGSLLLSSIYRESKIYTYIGNVRKNELPETVISVDQANEYRSIAYSNDGEKIAAVIRDDAGPRLLILTKDFELIDEIKLEHIPETVVNPLWTPDDKRVMVLDQVEGNSVNFVNLETKEIKRYTRVGGLGVELADGNILHGNYNNPEVNIYNIETGEQELVHTGPEESSSIFFRLSPDRKTAAYMERHRESDKSKLMLMDLGDFTVKNIYQNKPDESVQLHDWLDDGIHMIIRIDYLANDYSVKARQMHVLNIETGEATPFGEKMEGEDILRIVYNRQGTRAMAKKGTFQSNFWKLIY